MEVLAIVIGVIVMIPVVLLVDSYEQRHKLGRYAAYDVDLSNL